MKPSHFNFLILMGALAACLAGCTRQTNPAWATQPYPKQLHSTQVQDMQVLRNDTDIEIVNATPYSYTNFDLWINQRFVRHVDSLPAGKSITLSLWDFYDEFGDQFGAGGFFRADEATPVRLVEIQPAADQPMVGLIAIRVEPVKVAPEQSR